MSNDPAIHEPEESAVHKGAEFDEKSFWDKIASAAGKAGREVLETALSLFYCLTDKETPHWARLLIVGALAYFVMPIDAIPDFLVPAGYTDDLAILVGAVSALKHSLTQAHKDQAREWLARQLDDQDVPE